MTTKRINHVEYPIKLQEKTIEDILYIIEDCKKSINTNSDNSGYYADEIHYCVAELKRRKVEIIHKIDFNYIYKGQKIYDVDKKVRELVSQGYSVCVVESQINLNLF